MAPKTSREEMAIAIGLSAPLNFIIPRFRSDMELYSCLHINLTTARLLNITLASVRRIVHILDIKQPWVNLREQRQLKGG